MNKKKYNFIDVDVIVSILVACIFLGAAIFAFYTFTDVTDTGTTISDTFTVTNPAVDQNCNMGYEDLTITSVRQHLTNGTWMTISAANYDYVDTVVTVNASVLYG